MPFVFAIVIVPSTLALLFLLGASRLSARADDEEARWLATRETPRETPTGSR